MKGDVWKETEEFHSCFQSATFEVLHCEQYSLLEMLVGFLIKYCHKKKYIYKGKISIKVQLTPPVPTQFHVGTCFEFH